MDNLCGETRTADNKLQARRFGDLKLFEPITICCLSRYATAGALTEPVVAAWIAVNDVTCRLYDGPSRPGPSSLVT
jgi:hypothetical protein